VHLPGLAERPADVMPLFRLFLGEGIDRPPAITAVAAEALTLYGWPFNVRELQHAATGARVESVVSGAVDLECLPFEVREAHAERLRATLPADEVPLDRGVLEQALRTHRGNVSAAARSLGRSRQQLYRRLQLLTIDPAAFRDG